MGAAGNRAGSAGVSGLDSNDETMAIREESNYRPSHRVDCSNVVVVLSEFCAESREEALKICRAVWFVAMIMTLGGGAHSNTLLAQVAVSPGTGRGLPETID